MDPFVVEMHTRSGLLEAIRASEVSLADAGAATLAFIRAHAPEPRSVPLCGNSIGTDRRFLAAYLPDIEDHLHYRSIDVSSIKELVRRWYPKIGQARPQKVGQHRALDDIRDSIEELRYYRERVFVPPTPPTPSPSAEAAADARPSCSAATAGRRCSSSPTSTPPVPGPDEILVDVRHSALNRADVLQRMGLLRRPAAAAGSTAPEIPGLEYAGRVAAVGARVTDWPVGDAVMGIEAGGCYAEQVVDPRPAWRCRCRPGVDLADAAAVPEVFLTAWDALVVQGGLTSGRWALVHAGASGVGTAAIQIAKAIGARVAVTCSAGKADACRELGADLVLERSPADWPAALRAGLAEARRDATASTSCSTSSAARRPTATSRVVRPKGTIVQVGLMGGGAATVNLGLLLDQAGRAGSAPCCARGRWRRRSPISRRFADEVLPLFTAGALRPVIDRRFPLDDVADAHRAHGGRRQRRQDPPRRHAAADRPALPRRHAAERGSHAAPATMATSTTTSSG